MAEFGAALPTLSLPEVYEKAAALLLRNRRELTASVLPTVCTICATSPRRAQRTRLRAPAYIQWRLHAMDRDDGFFRPLHAPGKYATKEETVVLVTEQREETRLEQELTAAVAKATPALRPAMACAAGRSRVAAAGVRGCLDDFPGGAALVARPSASRSRRSAPGALPGQRSGTRGGGRTSRQKEPRRRCRTNFTPPLSKHSPTTRCAGLRVGMCSGNCGLEGRSGPRERRP